MDQKKLVDAEDPPGGDDGFGERLGRRQNYARGDDREPGHPRPLLARRELRQRCGRARLIVGFQLGFHFWQPAREPKVGAENQDQNDRVKQIDAVLQDDQKCVDTGHQQETDLQHVHACQLDGALAGAPPMKEHHQRPRHADQQPVGACHVGGGIVHIIRLRRLASLIGVVQIDGVLRQDCDERDKSQYQAL
ncbi:hypothetical protein D9M73_154810 [compost metagenome]